MNIDTLFLAICLSILIFITLWDMSIKSLQRDRIMNIFHWLCKLFAGTTKSDMSTVTHSLAMTAECWWEAFDYLRPPGHPIGWTWDWYYNIFHIKFMTNWYLEYKILQIIFKVHRYRFRPLLVHCISWFLILIVTSTLKAANEMLTLLTFWINISHGYHENQVI
jgi:hypothetical protein